MKKRSNLEEVCRLRKFRGYVCVSLIVQVLLAGCNNPKTVPLVEKDNITLNIGFQSEEAFEQRYSNILQKEYPMLKYNIVPMMDLYRGKTTVEEWTAAHLVDLIYIPSHLFQSFIDLGQLKPLEPYIAHSSYSLDDRVPQVMELAKLYGNGSLYGLPPTFFGSAIAYNKDLFDQLDIPYPTNGMSWAELISLAQRFPQGLSITYGSPLNWIQEMGAILDLRLYQETTRQANFNSSSWLQVWESSIEPLRNGNVLFDDINESPFLKGERAMAIISSDQLKRVEQQASGFDWDLVTIPVNPARPEVSTSLKAHGFYAIAQASPQSDDAWEVLRFLLSDRMAKWEAGFDLYGFSSLSGHLGINAEENKRRLVFHQLSPVLPAISDSLPEELRELASKKLEEWIASGKPLTQSDLDELQDSAEDILQFEAPNVVEE